MARIAGVDIPRDKRVEVSLRYIFGIGPSNSRKILTQTQVSPDTRVRELTEEEVNRIRELIDKEYLVEGDLRREVTLNINRLKEIRSTLPAITHVDYSARIQTVERTGNPLLYDLLLRFERVGDHLRQWPVIAD